MKLTSTSSLPRMLNRIFLYEDIFSEISQAVIFFFNSYE